MITLGALNKSTKQYTLPQYANKNEKYICPDCNKDLILVKGTKKVTHFRHYSEKEDPCFYYDKPSESQIHKDAKLFLKSTLENKTNIIFNKSCNHCSKTLYTQIPIITTNSYIKIEHRFEYNGLKIADIAYLNNNNIDYIFEICHKHKTKDEDRPEPWFEIDAMNLIENREIVNNSLSINCIRDYYCQKCKTQVEYKKNIDYLISKNVITKQRGRYPIFKFLLNKLNGEQIENLSDIILTGYIKGKINYSNKYIGVNYNKKIINSLKEFWIHFKIVIHSINGNNYIFFIKNENYFKYDYWNNKHSYLNNLPIIKEFNYISEEFYSNYTYDYSVIYLLTQIIKKTINYRDPDLLPKLNNEEEIVYIRVPFENKDKIKKYKSKWNPDMKLWTFNKDIFEKHKKKILTNIGTLVNMNTSKRKNIYLTSY